MSEKTDARIARSKKLIYSALLELMEEKGFDAITVGDITSRGGLNRGTFYLHYRDKYDLLEQYQQEVLGGLFKHMSKISPEMIAQHPSAETPPQIIQNIFEYIGDNSAFFRVMLGPKGDPACVSMIRERLESYMHSRFKEIQPAEGKELVPREYLIAYVSNANLGVIQRWLTDGMTYSPQFVAGLVYRMAKYGPLQYTGIPF
ncbi:TetR/AcrR family transcriptional regulator [Paenibacillus sp. GD4]|uniref:TetR/AcrR family transcriptional regulator n=1 Tax=Paenibacillus sp. GD4 TaxID=3068890 RepID=UPI002796B02A|nr:TetR/AcrR family transcriptional regulator [Paenibacillus sp. GD4]MDQ1912176.1 TetR/AcrR family transcriptional regulator [Paenibacillus sp. GD4]